MNRQIYEQLPGPQVSNVKRGDIIVDRPGEDTEERETVKWMVQQVYPYFVYATSGSRHKCFDMGMLVQMGLEYGFTDIGEEGKDDE